MPADAQLIFDTPTMAYATRGCETCSNCEWNQAGLTGDLPTEIVRINPYCSSLAESQMHSCILRVNNLARNFYTKSWFYSSKNP